MFQKATRTQSRLRLGISGPAGSGKTLTALVVACYIAEKVKGRVALIDSERASAAKYAGLRFSDGMTIDFDHCVLDDFSPKGYGAHYPRLDWVIAGAESGPGARPMNEDWVRSVRDQCLAAGVAFFYKQAAVNGRKVSLPVLDGRQWMEFPEVRNG